MKSLTEHDAERMERHRELQELNKAHADGIACPTCGKELWDTDPMMTLMSNPPRKSVHCPACGYAGSRIA